MNIILGIFYVIIAMYIADFLFRNLETYWSIIFMVGVLCLIGFLYGLSLQYM